MEYGNIGVKDTSFGMGHHCCFGSRWSYIFRGVYDRSSSIAIGRATCDTINVDCSHLQEVELRTSLASIVYEMYTIHFVGKLRYTSSMNVIY